MNFRKTRPGVSLLIALIITGLLLLFGLFMSNIVISSVRQSAETIRANQAFYAAEGAMEIGLLENSQHGAGYSSPIKNIDLFLKVCGSSPTPECIATLAPGSGKVKIEGLVEPTAKFSSGPNGGGDWYGIPTPGTGTAGKNCDPLKAVIAQPFYYPEGSQVSYEPEEHPCNWNILKIGEVATIPLYTYDDGNVVNLLDANSQLKLKIRTPCINGEYICKPGPSRFGWDIVNGDPQYDGNDPIVTWQIVGTDPNATQEYKLGPYIYIQNNNIKNASTIITENKLILANDASTDYKLLSQTSPGLDENNCKGQILNFLTNAPSVLVGCNPGAPLWDTYTIAKPVLTFTIIQSMKSDQSDQNETIPYLEYQILADTPLAPINATQIITAEGFSGPFKQTLQVKQPKSSSLPEYVIQQ